jgi:hypothetical protein
MKTYTYSEALTSAIKTATMMECACVVRYWGSLNQFHDTMLSSSVLVQPDNCTVVASVDHKGRVTESPWLLETIAKGVNA